MKQEKSAESTIEHNLANSLESLSKNMEKEMKVIESQNDKKLSEQKKHEENQLSTLATDN